MTVTSLRRRASICLFFFLEDYRRCFLLTCPCSARGITVEGHHWRGAWWWNRLFHINRVFNFAIEIISSKSVIKINYLNFIPYMYYILPKLKLSELEARLFCFIYLFIHLCFKPFFSKAAILFKHLECWQLRPLSCLPLSCLRPCNVIMNFTANIH